MHQIQISIGTGSMGLVYKAAADDQLSALFAQAAVTMGYTAEVVEQKLRAGSTLWLNRAEEQKIRGYDVAAAELAAVQREAARVARQRSDGYFSNY